MYIVRQATADDAAALVAGMRKADAEEVWAGWRQTPEEAVRVSLAGSRDPLAGLAPDGRLLCLFGVTGSTVLSDTAAPWMLGTDELPKHAMAFLRVSRSWTRLIKEEYSMLENFVDMRNRLAVRWLRWLGFTVEEARPFGPGQLPFHRFTWRRS